MHIYTAAQSMNSNKPAAALCVPNLGTCTLRCRNLKRQVDILTNNSTLTNKKVVYR